MFFIKIIIGFLAVGFFASLVDTYQTGHRCKNDKNAVNCVRHKKARREALYWAIALISFVLLYEHFNGHALFTRWDFTFILHMAVISAFGVVILLVVYKYNGEQNPERHSFLVMRVLKPILYVLFITGVYMLIF